MQTATTPAASTASHSAAWPPAKQCPRHGSVLTGGPVIFTCSTGPLGGHSVAAADLPANWA
jgi:hypothetical protein